MLGRGPSGASKVGDLGFADGCGLDAGLERLGSVSGAWRVLGTLMLAWLAFWCEPACAAVLDPSVVMRTMETPHFRISFPQGYEAVAEKSAVYAEAAYTNVCGYFKTWPSQKTELILFDQEDTVNGLALPYVNNAMYVYLTNPDSDLLWGRYDDWLKLVITHEFTHIMHFETVDGLPGLLNRVFGRLLFPNLFQPTFLIEGLAVTTESLFTAGGKGGRGHDGYFDMYLRADVLANRQLSIDQASGYYLTDFPGGDAPYVYGTFFYKYLAKRYGADLPARLAHVYSAAPWLGVDHALGTLIPGQTVQGVWDDMRLWLVKRAEAQMTRIRQRPVTATTPVTETGMNHRHPVYLPDGRLTFIEGLRHSPTAVKVVDKLKDGTLQLTPLLRKSHYGGYDVSRDGRYFYFQNAQGPNNYWSYDDVFRLDLREGHTEQLTRYARLSNPGVSPDGNKIVCVQNGKGTNNLVLLDTTGKVLRRLTALEDNSQFTAPRWSPDGRWVVMSAWREGSRDVVLLDTTTWNMHQLWKDAAVDVGPVWSPDGRYIVFASDRDGGVFNLFAYRMGDERVFRVTNVLTGVCEPAISPDGKTIAMSYCRGVGYDIHTMPFQPQTWEPAAQPVLDTAITPLAVKIRERYPISLYSPLTTLAPKFWSPIFTTVPALVGAFSIGYDVLLTNTVFGLAGYTLSSPGTLPPDPTTGRATVLGPQDLWTMNLVYANTQYDINWNVYASMGPQRYGIPLPNGVTVDLYQRTSGVGFGFGRNNLPSPLTNASYQVGDVWNAAFNVRLIQDLTPARENKVAVDARLIPPPGRAHSVSLSGRISDNGRFGYSISPEYGSLSSWGTEFAHELLGSEFAYFRMFGDTRRFFAMPWQHHVLAVRGMAGLNMGKPVGDFYLGGTRAVSQAGTPDIRVASDPDDVVVSLRGYPFASAVGNTLGLVSTEYRLPLLEIQRGPGVLPFFAERLYGTLFCDAATCYTNTWLPNFLDNAESGARAGAKLLPGLQDCRIGIGSELRLNFRIANNPLNTVPLSIIARTVWPALQSFGDSSGVFRLGVAQGVLPLLNGKQEWLWQAPIFYTEFGTYF